MLPGLVLALVLFSAGAVFATTVPTDPEPDKPCPSDFGTGLLTHYKTTVNTPADSADWWVSVEFTLADGDVAASCELSLVSYELASNAFSYPQVAYDWDSGTFGAGTHTLTVQLPRQGDEAGCWAQYDFVFGPAIENLTGQDKYGDRQIRARIVGADSCDIQSQSASPSESVEASVEASASVSESASASESASVSESASASEEGSSSPEQSVQGGTGTPEQSNLPDTSVGSTATTASWLVGLFGLFFILSLGSMAFLAQRSRHTR